MPECDLGRQVLRIQQVEWNAITLHPLHFSVRRQQISHMIGAEVNVIEAIRGEDVVDGSGLESLSLGEVGLRMTMQRFLRKSMLEDRTLPVVAFLEEDVLIHQEFRSIWKIMQETPRCTSFLLSETGGVLLLGASEWTLDAWGVLEQTSSDTVCYNALQRTAGMFAVLVARSTLSLIEEWLDSSNRPLDHMYEYLMQRGVPVRVAYPNLMIAEVNKTSSVNVNRPKVEIDVRYRAMRWDRGAYM